MQKLSYLEASKTKPIWDLEEKFKIETLLNKKHSLYLENEIFTLEAEKSKEQIQIKFSLNKKDNSFHYPIECVYIKESINENEQEIALNIIDYLDIYWANYFNEERNVFIPIDWSKHEFEGKFFYLRGFVRNLSLENEADAFLKKHGHGEYDIHSITSET
ncbi:hypothetical protein ACWNT8_03770 [Pigmentibacter ruber]